MHWTVPVSIPNSEYTIDLNKPGRQIGDLLVKWSDNERPLGFYPTPIICLSNGSGPTVMLTGGIHGDEFEGPAALIAQSIPGDDKRIRE